MLSPCGKRAVTFVKVTLPHICTAHFLWNLRLCIGLRTASDLFFLGSNSRSCNIVSEDAGTKLRRLQRSKDRHLYGYPIDGLTSHFQHLSVATPCSAYLLAEILEFYPPRRTPARGTLRANLQVFYPSLIHRWQYSMNYVMILEEHLVVFWSFGNGA